MTTTIGVLFRSYTRSLSSLFPSRFVALPGKRPESISRDISKFSFQVFLWMKRLLVCERLELEIRPFCEFYELFVLWLIKLIGILENLFSPFGHGTIMFFSLSRYRTIIILPLNFITRILMQLRDLFLQLPEHCSS